MTPGTEVLVQSIWCCWQLGLASVTVVVLSFTNGAYQDSMNMYREKQSEW